MYRISSLIQKKKKKIREMGEKHRREKFYRKEEPEEERMDAWN